MGHIVQVSETAVILNELIKLLFSLLAIWTLKLMTLLTGFIVLFIGDVKAPK